MEINKENFEAIVERLFNKLEEADKKMDRLLNHDACLKGDELLDNQDSIGMLKVSHRFCCANLENKKAKTLFYCVLAFLIALPLGLEPKTL